MPRLERLIIDYIGAEDNELNRAMTRKHFTAAVARVMQPGCKYDYCLVLTGPEGVGKSTLLTIMGGEWFNDSVTTTEGKEGMECLRRAWIVEMGELSSIKRSDVESIKAYLSKRVDIYRAAYAKRTAEQPRQCVFCGTTNETLFLKGETGNRRFWIINVDPAKRKFENWREAIERDRDQLWAEAVHNFKQGEKLYLSAELETQARQRQGEHNLNTEDPTVEALRKFLEMLLPETWYDKNSKWRYLYERRDFVLNGPEYTQEPCTIKRDRVCAAEFVKEYLGLTERDGAKYKQEIRFVNQILRSDFPEWEALKSIDFPEPYGKQRGFKRLKSKTDTFDDADL